MAQRIYATASDYFDFIGEDGPEATEPPTPDKALNATLRRASAVIDGLLRLARYATDEDGMPTDPKVSDALMEATCAQAAWFDETGDVTGADSQAGPTRIGSVSFGGSGASGGATNTKSAATSRISPEAQTILANEGLSVTVNY